MIRRSIRPMIHRSMIRRSMCMVWLTLCWTASAPAATLPNVLLITVDTTRADSMGFLGSKRGLTPNLDRLARSSVVFTHAYSQAPFTAPSHATILTGTYPQFHQVSDFQVPLAKDLPYAPAILKAQGYHTAAFVGSIVLDPAQGLSAGYDRAFDYYDAGFHLGGPGQDRYSSTERRGSDVVAHALAWLKIRDPGPFFMWVHVYDAHYPYDPPEPFLSRYKSKPYDGGIAYVDSVMGKLLDELRAHGLFENTLIAVMSDHGEALGDHGEEFHGFFLYDATIRVPLLLKLPEQRSAGKRVENPVGLVDVLPTILQAVGVAVPQDVQGKSLLDLVTESKSKPLPAAGLGMAEPSSSDPPLYAETDYGVRAYGWSALRSLRTGKYLFIEAPRRELYDLSADPNAKHNLAATSKAVAETLQSQLDDFRRKTSKSVEAPTGPTDPAVQEKLAALGYTASNSESAANAAKGIGPDPKDKIDIGNMMARANFLLEIARDDEAVLLLKKVIAKDPDMWIVYAKLGAAETNLGNLPEAVKAKRKAVELVPGDVNLHYELGNTLMKAQDFEGAIPELEIVTAKKPESWKTHILLGIAYSRTDRFPQAIKECETVLTVLPEQFGTNLLLGQNLLRVGHPEAALPSLTKAASLRPQAPQPHEALAEAYDALGRHDDAERERDLAKHLAEN
jgi:arylsulfatase A-like enzyme/cytochrome c-type biogenesis protein CcmH/NrfG